MRMLAACTGTGVALEEEDADEESGCGWEGVARSVEEETVARPPGLLAEGRVPGQMASDATAVGPIPLTRRNCPTPAGSSTSTSETLESILTIAQHRSNGFETLGGL